MLVRISIIPIKVTIVELVEDNTKHVEDNIELVGRNIEFVDFIVTNSKVEPFEFLSTNLPLTPPQINVRPEIALIFNTPHQRYS